MGTKSREVIWGGRIIGAGIRARGAREDANKAIWIDLLGRARDDRTAGDENRSPSLGYAVSPSPAVLTLWVS